MRSSAPAVTVGSFPKPEGALKWLLGAIFGLWVVFAVLINWVGVGSKAYEALELDIGGLLRGEAWRLFTAPFVHIVSGHGGVSHVTSTLMILYFFGVPLQRAWGPRRFLFVLAASALAGEFVQVVATLVAPATLGRVIGQPVLLGGHAMAVAAVIAWGFSHREQTVQLFFVMPIRGIYLVYITIGLELLGLIAAGGAPEGILAPFGGMLMGYLLGGATPSPLRRLLMRRHGRAIARGLQPRLRVIPGERGSERTPNDKRWMN